MFVTLAGFKGGVGKTTSAVHLAAYLAQTSENVLLVDGDPNRSSLGWQQRGNLPFKVCDVSGAARASQGMQHVVIDTEAHPNAKDMAVLAEGCDLLLLPTTPDALSLEALLKTSKTLGQSANYAAVITMVKHGDRADADQAVELMRENKINVCDQMIRHYKAYKKAALAGVPVNQLPGSSDSYRNIAWGDYAALGAEVEKLVEGLSNV